MAMEIGLGCFALAGLLALVLERLKAAENRDHSEKARRLARIMLAGKTIRKA